MDLNSHTNYIVEKNFYQLFKLSNFMFKLKFPKSSQKKFKKLNKFKERVQKAQNLFQKGRKS